MFGGGGYLGALVFGFLQRCSSLYGTGVGGGERGCPRSICATSLGSSSLNKYLVTHFKLAFAGENLVSLADMTDVNYIARVYMGGLRRGGVRRANDLSLIF